MAFEKCEEKGLVDNVTGKTRHFEKGHNGWTIDDFLQLEQANPSEAEKMPYHRLYSGKLYAPWNSALRKLVFLDTDQSADTELLEWATSVSILYEALILLGGITPPMIVL